MQFSKWAARLFKSGRGRRSAQSESRSGVRLSLIHLEDRRVLNGAPIAVHAAGHGGSSGGQSASTVEIVRNGADVDILVDATLVRVEPLSDITNIEIDGAQAGTTLIVDFSGGDPIPQGGIQFDAAAGPTAGPNAIVLNSAPAGMAFGNITDTLTAANAGSISLSPAGSAATSVITFSNVTQVSDLLTASERDFNLAGGATDFTLSAAPTGDPGVSQLTTALGDSFTFANPQNSLGVDALSGSALGSSADSLQLAGLGSGFNANLSLSGFSLIQVTGSTDVGAGQTSISANEIDILAPLRSTGAAANFVAQQLLNVEQGGSIAVGSGGSLLLEAPQINDQGLLTAVGGQVTLDAGPTGTLLVSGAIDASNTRAGGTGGTVELLGEYVGLTGSALVDAQGDAGGGTILVGGNLHGQGSTLTASQTYIGPGTTLEADALNSGSGGEVVVWSDQATYYYGSISAAGGASSGAGGYVEVSSHQDLDFDGAVNVGAVAGQAGTLLLDPANIVITATTTTTGIKFNPPTTLTEGFSDDSGDNPVDIGANLLDSVTAGTIELDATNSITVLAAVSLNSGVSLVLNSEGTITIGASITTAGTGALTVETTGPAAGAITVSDPLIAGGALTLETTGSVTGSITFDGSLTAGGALTISGNGVNAAVTNTAWSSNTSISINGGGGTVLLPANVNSTGTVTVENAATVTLESVQASTLILGGTATGMGVSGDVTQNEGTSTADLDVATLEANVSGSLTLAATDNNEISSLGAMTVGDLVLDNDVALSINGDITASGLGASISISSPGITQASGSTVSIGGTVAGPITLDGLGDPISLSGTLATPGEVTIHDATTVSLGNIQAGTLSLGSRGDITGAVTQTSGTDLDITTLVASTNGTTGSVTLNAASMGDFINQIDTLGSISTAQLVVDTSSALTIDGPVTTGTNSITTNGSGVTVAGTATLSGGSITIDGGLDPTTINGSLTASSGSVSVSGTGVNVAGTAVLSGSSISINGGTGATSINSVLNTAGSLTISGTVVAINASLSGAPVSISGGGGAITLDAAVNSSGSVTIDDASTVVLGNITAATLNLGSTSGISGAVTQAAHTSLDVTTLNANTSGSVTLSSTTLGGAFANQISTLGSVTTGQLVVDTSTTLTVNGPVNSGANSLTLDATGLLTVNGSVTATGSSPIFLTGNGVTQSTGSINAATLNVTSGSSVTLNSSSNQIAALGAITGNGALTVADSTALTVNGPISVGDHSIQISTSGGLLTLNASLSTTTSSITLQGVGITQNSGAAVNAGSGTISLNGGGGAISLSDSLTTSTTVTIDNASTVSLGNITAATLNLGSTSGISGAVTQAAHTGLGVTTLNANTSGSVTLSSTTLGGAFANQISTLGSVTTGQLVVDTSTALTVNGPVNSGANSLTLDATGLLTLNGSMTATGSSPILLTGNGVTQSTGSINAASLNVTSGSSVTLNSSSNQITALGAITANGALTVMDSTALTVNGPISVGDNPIQISTNTGLLTLNGSLSTTSSSITLQGVGITQNSGAAVNAGSGTISLNGGGGAISLGGGLTTSTTVSIDNASTVSLGNINAATLNLGSTSGISGAVTQIAHTSLDVTTLNANTSGSVTLSSTTLGSAFANQITTLGSVTTGQLVVDTSTALTVNGPVNSGANSLTLDATGLLTLNGSVTATGSSPILLTGNGVTQSTGSINAATLNVTSGSSVTLNSSSNQIAALGAITANGALTVDDSTALTVIGPISVGDHSIQITSGGLLTLNGSLSTTSSSITLQGVGITQNSGAPINAGSGTISLNGGGGAISLSDGLTTSTTVAIDNASTVSLGNINAATLNLGMGTALSGAVTQTSSTSVDITTLNANSSGSVTLNATVLGGAFANQITTLGSVTTGQLVVDTSTALTVNGPVNSGANALTLDATGLLTVNGSVTATGSSPIVLAGNGITQNSGGPVSAGSGSISLNAQGGAITLADSLSSTGSVTIDNASSVTLGNINARTLNLGSTTGISGAVTQASGTSLDVTTLNANTSGSVTLDATTLYSGFANQITSLGTVTTGQLVVDTSTALTVNGPVNSGANSLTLDATGLLTVNGSVTATGSSPIFLTGNGVTQSTGSLNAATLNVNSGGSVTLNSSGNQIHTLGSITANGALTVKDATALTVNGPISIGDHPIQITTSSGRLTINVGLSTTTSSITLQGVGIQQNNGAAINAGSGTISLNGGGQAITLNDGLTTTSSVAIDNASNVELGNITAQTLNLGMTTVISGPVVQNPDTSVNIGTLNANTSNSVALNAMSMGLFTNQISALGSVTTGQLVVDTSTALIVTGPVSATHVITLDATGLLTINGNVTVSNNNPVFLDGDGITQNSNSTVSVTTGSGAISLNGGGGAISLFGALSTAGDVTIQNATTVALGTVHAHALTLSTDQDITGAITQNTGSLDVSTLNVNAGSSVTLNGSTNQISTLAAITANGALTLADSTALIVNGPISVGDNPIQISSTGGLLTLNVGLSTNTSPITLQGVGITQAVGATINAGSGAISLNGGGQAITLNDDLTTTTSVTIDNASSVALGNISADSLALGSTTGLSGAVTQATGTSLTVNALTGYGTGSVTLNATSSGGGFANQINVLGSFTSGQLVLDTDTTLSVTGPVNSGANPLTLDATGLLEIGGNITASGNNAISLTGNGVSQNSGSTIGVSGSSGSITIDGGSDQTTINGTVSASAGTLSVSGTGVDVSSAAELSGNPVNISGDGQQVTLNGTVTSTGAVTIDNASNAMLGNITAQTLNLGTTVGISGSVTQFGGTSLDVATLNANTSGSVTLNALTNQISALGSVSTGQLVIDTSTTLTVTGPVNSGANPLTLDAAGLLTLNGNVTASGNNAISLAGVGITQAAVSNISSDSGNITLDGGGAAISLSGNLLTALQPSAIITIQDASTVVLGGVSAGELDLQGLSGNVSQGSGSLQVLNLQVQTTGGVQLTQTNNQIQNLLTSNVGGIQLVDQSSLVIGGNVAAANSGNISIQAAGIMQSAGFSLTADLGTIDLDGSGAAINLAGSVSTNNATVSSILLHNANGITLNSLQTAGDVVFGSNQDVTGMVSQAGAIIANGINLSGNATYTLNNTGNAFTTLAGDVVGNVNVTDAGALQIGTVVTSGLSVDGNLVLQAGGDITESAPLNVTGTTGLQLSTPNSNVSLNSQPNDFQGSVSIGGNGNVQDVSLHDIDAATVALSLPATMRNLTLDFDNEGISLPSISLSGNLVLAVNGPVSQGAQTLLNVAGTTNISTGADPITLFNTGNTFAGVVTLTNSGPNAVSLLDASPLVLGALNLGTGVWTFQGQSVSETSPLLQASGGGPVSITATAGPIALGLQNNFIGPVSLANSGPFDVTLVDTGTLSLGTVQTDAGNVNITVGGGLMLGNASISTTTGNVTLATPNGALNMSATGTIDSSSGAIDLSAKNDVTLGTLSTTGTAFVDSSSGSIVDGGGPGPTVTAGALGLQASTGIGSASPLRTAVTTLAATTGSGGIQVTNNSGAAPLTIGSVGAVSGLQTGGGQSQTSGSSQIVVTNVGPIVVAGPVLNPTGGDITLDAGSPTSSENLAINSPVLATGGNGNVNLTANGNLSINSSGASPMIEVTGTGTITADAASYSVGPNVLLQSGTGQATGPLPTLTNVNVPQITSSGVGQVSGTVGPSGNTNVTFSVNWNDGTTNTETVATPLTFDLQHQYLGNPDGRVNSANPIPITITLENDPHIDFVGDNKVSLVVQAIVPGTGIGGFNPIATPPPPPLNTTVYRVDPAPQGLSAPPVLLPVTEMQTPPSDVKVTESRQVVLNTVLPGGGEREAVRLGTDVLNNMPALFNKLPDGRYRLYLTEPGSGQRRMVIDVDLREGRPMDPTDESEGSQNRPASTGVEPNTAPTVGLPAGHPIELRATMPAPEQLSNTTVFVEARAQSDPTVALRAAAARIGAERDGEEQGTAGPLETIATPLLAGGAFVVIHAAAGPAWPAPRNRRRDEAMRRLDTKPLARAARLLRRWQILPGTTAESDQSV